MWTNDQSKYKKSWIYEYFFTIFQIKKYLFCKTFFSTQQTNNHFHRRPHFDHSLTTLWPIISKPLTIHYKRLHRIISLIISLTAVYWFIIYSKMIANNSLCDMDQYLTHIYIHTFTYSGIQIKHTHTYIHIHRETHTHTHKHTFTYTEKHTYTHSHIHLHTQHSHKHTYTHI